MSSAKCEDVEIEIWLSDKFAFSIYPSLYKFSACIGFKADLG